jgi:hypothetical protein
VIYRWFYRVSSENIDELRTQNSAIFSKQCAADTRLQLERRREDMEKELAAEAEFTKVLEADRLRKEQREKDEAEARHRSNLLTKQILDEQTALREKLKGNSHAEREREMAKYAAMAAADAEKLAKREEAMMAAKRTAQREILKFNEDYQASKASAKAQRLAEERAMNIAAAEALAGEAGRKEAEKKARLQVFSISHWISGSWLVFIFFPSIDQEMVEYSAYINSLKAEQAKIDAELEKMRAEAQEAAWRQRESKWNAEQAAREALNREVNESIRQQLLYRAEMQAKEIEEGKRIQAMLVAEQQRLEAEEKRRYAERIEKSNNRELMQQIADRERARKEEFEAGVREAALMKQREEEKRLLLESELRNYKPEPRSFALKTTKWYT